MRVRKVPIFLSALALSLAAAWAQAPAPATSNDHKQQFTFDIMGGATIPTGPAAARFNPGWNLGGGIGANLSDAVAVIGEYLYSDLPADGTLLGSSLSGREYIHSFGPSLMYSVGGNRGLTGYIIGGPGAYYRKINISQYAGTGVAPYCDPYFFYCYAVPVTYTNVIGSRDEWDWGLNAGLGIQYGFPGGEPHLFIEGRYHYIFGHSYDTPSGSKSSSAGYVPLVLGLRW
jgi:opacity protein-like surface antigen